LINFERATLNHQRGTKYATEKSCPAKEAGIRKEVASPQNKSCRFEEIDGGRSKKYTSKGNGCGQKTMAVG
jgi:hypothetical protein